MDSVTQRRLPREERAPQMLDVAVRVFGERGYHGASMDEIAAAAGVTKPMFYAYFGSKDDLYAACIDHVAHQLEAALAQAGADEESTERQTWARLLAFFRFVDERRAEWRVLRREAGEFGDELARARETIVQLTLRQLEEAAPGTASPEELLPLAHSLAGAAEALANWWIDNPGESAEAIAVRHMNLIWLGLEGMGEGRYWAPGKVRKADPERPARR